MFENHNGRFLLFSGLCTIVVFLLVWLLISVVAPRLNRLVIGKLDDLSSDRIRDGVRRMGFTARQTHRMFDNSSDAQNDGNYYSLEPVGTDAFDDTIVNGPLVPSPCSKQDRVCLRDEDCALLCRGAATETFYCSPTDLVCRPNPVIDGGGGIDPPDSQPDVNCKTDKGEYALLEGYNELGIAQWTCVQLYPGWSNPGVDYCENGQVNIDTRFRPPSYKDCVCPEGTQRVVYARSQLGQQVFGLPHCVTQPHLYRADYLFL